MECIFRSQTLQARDRFLTSLIMSSRVESVSLCEKENGSEFSSHDHFCFFLSVASALVHTPAFLWVKCLVLSSHTDATHSVENDQVIDGFVFATEVFH